ncbi:hypothetical protein GC177_09800 [bacterium]|nr:hypothetical protein [bacterium]
MTNTQNNSSKQGQKSGSKNPGNFKNNPQRAAEAGRKGGQASSGGNR